MSRAPRVMLDTNVALSALLYLFIGDRDLLSLASEFSPYRHRRPIPECAREDVKHGQ